ncbi:MAG: hypothetical protein A3F70_09950 [Acidobacteria bacterium RIFCSPLOWO2_12_FULL_67_14]|nr:MAG: hypothetical protein A3H29_00160 [Acidobacteria bacterium RIFCSPLOWO2_02_FULL_67_21]OFW38074.1 MAG: hypothetical protein A3F70_09950 [Acidobacteria bacterium RIFCSPLOWO2_12_FULL_67_14]
MTNTRTGHTIASRLRGAFDSRTRRTGLLRTDTFERGEAMVIAPTNAIHTWGMRYPIDVAFVARDGRVLKIRAAVPPWRCAAAWGAYAVIELPAGTLAESGVVPGDVLTIAPHQPDCSRPAQTRPRRLTEVDQRKVHKNADS